MLIYKYINVNTNICYIDFNEYKYNKINNKIIQYNNNNNNNNNDNNNNNNKTHLFWGLQHQECNLFKLKLVTL